MPSIHLEGGGVQDVTLEASVYRQAHEANQSVSQFINNQHPNTDVRYGTAFQQLLAGTGLVVPSVDAQRNFGMRAPTMHDVLEGRANLMGAANTSQAGGAFGTQSRILFPAALVAYMETSLTKDFETDVNQFDRMIAQRISIAGDKFEQPLINFNTPNGPMMARAQRRAQLAPPAAMMAFTTSDVARKIPTYALGMEFSNEALKVTTLDLVGLSVRRQLAVEKDSWVNVYLSNVYGGDNDINTGSLASLGFSIASATLDSASTGGVLTHDAWLKWLWRNRKYRKIDWVVCDLSTYLKIERRTGRPDTILRNEPSNRLDSQAVVQNNALGDVKVFIVDDAANGGPLPANTILGLDSRYALVQVRNTLADVSAAEKYALRQGEAFSIQFGEEVYRLHADAFDVLTIS